VRDIHPLAGNYIRAVLRIRNSLASASLARGQDDTQVFEVVRAAVLQLVVSWGNYEAFCVSSESSISLRNALLTDAESGNTSATSGDSTTTLVPAA